jgi:hypothetical protein
LGVCGERVGTVRGKVLFQIQNVVPVESPKMTLGCT